jgi:adenine-specific DNA-methyltransferase
MQPTEIAVEGLPLESLDPNVYRFAKLKELYPDAFVDGKLDADKLQQILGEDVETRPERYGLTWAGKSDAIKSIQSLSSGTLLPCRNESINFDSTENVIIEGDNLEVLKLLQRSYYGKIKMIYIDPPYNTGSEFIYPDNYKAGLQEYLRFSGQVSDEGYKLTTNAETSGRYHSRWLTMMYPRLFLARNLLRDDGVIFVSIDDHEAHNLRLIMNEIFGEENFVEQIIWKKRSTPPNDQVIGADHDYILIFAKDINRVGLNLRARSAHQKARYRNPDNHPKGPWTPGDLMANVKGGRYVASLYFAIKNPTTGQEHYPSSKGNWRFNREKIEKLIANNEIYFGEDGKGRPKLKRFLRDVKEGITYPTIWDFVPLNTEGSAEMADLLGNMTVFENPKPSGLIIELLKLGTDAESVVLDFFAGSGTTAHATMSLNKNDQGKRRFILVQLPEPTGREDFKTITDICKERVRRAIKKINEADEEELSAKGSSKQDRGFQVFKLNSSNFKIWDSEGTPKDEEKLAAQLKLMVHNVVDDRGPDDLLYELILKSGLALTSKIDKVTAAGLPAFSIENGTLIVCLARPVTQPALREIIALHPQRVLCLDVGFTGNDQLKTNIVLEMKSHGVEFRTV